MSTVVQSRLHKKTNIRIGIGEYCHVGHNAKQDSSELDRCIKIISQAFFRRVIINPITPPPQVEF